MDKRKDIVNKALIDIDGNILKYKNAVIQLSNVSKVDVAPIPKQSCPVMAVVGILIAFILMTVYVYIGILIIVVCFVWIYLVYEHNEKLGKYLMIELNSGNILMFSCNDEEFLVQALEMLIRTFNGDKEKYFINFGNCQIGDRNIIRG